jgi:hypothetical protein
MSAQLAVECDNVEELQGVDGAASLRKMYGCRKPFITLELLTMGYTMIAIAEVDVNVVNAIGMYNDEVFMTGFGIDAVIVPMPKLYSES